MTVKGLIKRLSSFDEDMEVELQYQDDGGCYEGSGSCQYVEVEHKPYGDVIVLA